MNLRIIEAIPVHAGTRLVDINAQETVKEFCESVVKRSSY